jgi:hypothetical protein
VKKLVYIKTNTIQLADPLNDCYKCESDEGDGVMEVDED